MTDDMETASERKVMGRGRDGGKQSFTVWEKGLNIQHF